jgi:coproporphyrinogen III oxidase-like Fe-S oxidoreductase
MRGSIFANTFSLQEYINKLGQGRLPLSFRKQFSEKELMRYDFLMRLFGRRLDIDELEKKYSGNFYKSLWKEILFFKMAGAIEEKNDFLCLAQKGLYYWVIMMREFFTGVNNFREYCRLIPYTY